MEAPSVSRSFLKDLKLMDSRLNLKFNSKHWVVTYDRPVGEPANIYRIKNDDGSYRPPDTRDLIHLKGGDLCNEDMQTRLRKLSLISERIKAKAKQDAYDNIRSMTLENKTQLANAAVRLTNQGKGRTGFRQVDYRRKGKTFSEITAEATA